MTHYFLRLGLLFAIGISSVTYAATLGEARVRSFLSQPLDAEIPLIGLATGEHEDLRLRIANDRHFERLGIAHDPLLNDLRFEIVRSGDQWLVRVRSTKPVREPFLDFPLQMSWPGGRLIKQYTLLLDPPTRIQPARASSAPRAEPLQAPVAGAPTAGDTYGPVRSGETLWPIAQKLKPRGITTRQMAMALLRANPGAFIDDNVNNLRAGATLTIPPRAFIEELDAESARAEFAAQSKRWQAPAVATSPRTLDRAVSAPAERVTDRQEPGGATLQTADSQDQLRIVTDQKKRDAETTDERVLKEQLLVTMEEIESNRLTAGAMETRLARLESELDRMQKLIELKDAQIAALRSEMTEREQIRGAAEQVEKALPVERPPQLPAGLQVPGQAADDVRAKPATAAAVSAPAAVATIDTTAPVRNSSVARPWHEEYLWVIWVVLAFLGLAALLLMFRRPQVTAMDIPMADLPQLRESVPGARPPRVDATESAALKKAEEDFRRLSRERLGQPQTSADGLPELDIGVRRSAGQVGEDDVSETLLDEMLEDSKLLDNRAETAPPEVEFSDDDIASWIEELGVEVENNERRSADEKLEAEDDIPSLLSELDDQLTSTDTATSLPAAGVNLQPLDDTYEDDTFSMSLDLARAYLEIGDPDGARDMLNQALAGARNPDHRRQIEELLAQIG